MSDDIFEFDIDSQLEEAEVNAKKRVEQEPEWSGDDQDCEGCKI